MSARVEDVLIPGSPRDILILTACKRWAQITGTADADASAIIAALRAAGLVIEQGWQPIETCPDTIGDAHFAWWQPEFSTWNIERCETYQSPDRAELETAKDIAINIGCTIWRPLPALPAPPQETTDA